MMIHPETARLLIRRAVELANQPHEVKVSARPSFVRHKMYFGDYPAVPVFSKASADLLPMAVEIAGDKGNSLWGEVLAESLAGWIRDTCGQAKEGQKYSLVLGDFGMEVRERTFHFYAGFLLDEDRFTPPARETLAPITEPTKKGPSLRDQIEECRDNEAAFVRAFCAGPVKDERVAKILYRLGKDPSRRIAVLTSVPRDILKGMHPAQKFIQNVDAARSADEVMTAVFPEVARAPSENVCGFSAWRLLVSKRSDPSLFAVYDREDVMGMRVDEVLCFDFDPATASDDVRRWYNEIVMPRVLTM